MTLTCAPDLFHPVPTLSQPCPNPAQLFPTLSYANALARRCFHRRRHFLQFLVFIAQNRRCPSPSLTHPVQIAQNRRCSPPPVPNLHPRALQTIIGSCPLVSRLLTPTQTPTEINSLMIRTTVITSRPTREQTRE